MSSTNKVYNDYALKHRLAYFWFSSRQACKKDRIKEPVNTTSSTISIALKVFFFCISYLLIDHCTLSSSLWSGSVLFALHHFVYRCLPLFTLFHRLCCQFCCQPTREIWDLIWLDKLICVFALSNYTTRIVVNGKKAISNRTSHVLNPYHLCTRRGINLYHQGTE